MFADRQMHSGVKNKHSSAVKMTRNHRSSCEYDTSGLGCVVVAMTLFVSFNGLNVDS